MNLYSLLKLAELYRSAAKYIQPTYDEDVGKFSVPSSGSPPDFWSQFRSDTDTGFGVPKRPPVPVPISKTYKKTVRELMNEDAVLLRLNEDKAISLEDKTFMINYRLAELKDDIGNLLQEEIEDDEYEFYKTLMSNALKVKKAKVAKSDEYIKKLEEMKKLWADSEEKLSAIDELIKYRIEELYTFADSSLVKGNENFVAWFRDAVARYYKKNIAGKKNLDRNTTVSNS